MAQQIKIVWNKAVIFELPKRLDDTKWIAIEKRRIDNLIHSQALHYFQNGYSGEWIVISGSKIALYSIRLIRHLFRWLNPLLKIGLHREIEDDDIYAVPNSLRSDQNTEQLEKLWQVESKKKDPSFRRVIFQAYGVLIFTTELLYSIGEAMAR